MASSRLCGLLAVVCGLALASCAGSPNTVECASGVLCPEGMQCAAFQPVCLVNNCGNGKLDLGEICDDGNIVDGDGCSANCLSTERCGNGMIDQMAGEICDPPRARDPITGVGCSADCKSDLSCGNGIKDVGEACDDGNHVDADGCNATCTSTEVCGNGIKDVEVGEACDDGNTVSGDGCNADCRSGEGCGNGILDPGEECDDGNMSDNDDCLHTCKRNVCGDGIINSGGTHKETCDAGTTGTPVETASCNLDCTIASCGDGKVNQTAGEECDDGFGNNKDTNNCVSNCKLNICGDGKVDMQPPRIEQCDDGNTNNSDGCNNACQLASCGNGQIDPGEQCDDGNNITTDACVSCHNAICGDGFVEAGIEQCDDGNAISGDGCSSTCRTEGCGNGRLDPGEQCDDGNMDDTDACLGTCKIAVCGDGKVHAGTEQCDDGNKVNGDGCSANCQLEGCGNGTLDPGEQCDDGNKVSGDGCSATCQFEACGDGIVNNGEQCDGHGETATCNADCTLVMCGDSKVNAHAGEQCDQGVNNSDNKDCTAGCKINVCGDGHVDSLGSLPKREQCDDGNTNNNDGCSNACMSAACGNGLLDPGEQCDDMNTINTDSCVNCQTARCGDGFVQQGVEECDGAAIGGFQCSAKCRLEKCGNGIKDPLEQCDDGNNSDGDGCSAGCKFEFCGDGFQNNGEVCDPSANDLGSNNNKAACNSDCTLSSCGDGKVNHFASPPEACDSTVGCEPPGDPKQCTLPFCGNGSMDAGEQCDNGGLNGTAGNSCDSLCQTVACGNGIIEATESMENCDDGNNMTEACIYGVASCIVCDNTCKTKTVTGLYCGDGMPGGSEMCDQGVTGGTLAKPVNGTTVCAYNTTCTLCSSDCASPTMPTKRVCGDGTIDTDGAEICDQGMSNITGTATVPCLMHNGICIECLGNVPVTTPGTGNSCKVIIPVLGPYCGDNVCDDGVGMHFAGGETAANCSDCAVCGNGTVDASERCDFGMSGMTEDCAVFDSTHFAAGQNATCTTCKTLDTSACIDIATPSCSDGVQNQGESDLDCGGSGNGCVRCANGKMCAAGTDCVSTSCISNVCTAVAPPPTCSDTMKNEMESDIDCGGPNCAGCPVGKTCVMTSDCAGGLICNGSNKCATPPPPPTCTDSIKNQDETDKDCGGMTCFARCAVGKTCAINGDCASGNCMTGLCKP